MAPTSRCPLLCVCVCVGTARPDAHSSNSCLTCTHLNSASTGGEAGGAAGAHRPGRPEQAGAPARLGHLKPLAYSPFQQLRHDTSCGRAAETVRAWRQPQRQLFMHHLSGWQLAAALQLAPGCPACLVDATLTSRIAAACNTHAPSGQVIANAHPPETVHCCGTWELQP